mmetsp:Transcript_25427/g.31268  ORF Transcript_25427/g.31268 Transcript_25427/m.31268 type:complete len:264 (+) Transcript_25427:176-967(+)
MTNNDGHENGMDPRRPSLLSSCSTMTPSVYTSDSYDSYDSYYFKRRRRFVWAGAIVLVLAIGLACVLLAFTDLLGENKITDGTENLTASQISATPTISPTFIDGDDGLMDNIDDGGLVDNFGGDGSLNDLDDVNSSLEESLLRACDEDTNYRTELLLYTDSNAQEISWNVHSPSNLLLFSSAIDRPVGDYYENSKPYDKTMCLPRVNTDQCYSLTISDSGGDGICCGSSGDGWYELVVNGIKVKVGGKFEYQETSSFGGDGCR